MQNKGTVYTIGYEGKSITQFIRQLKKIGIEQLVITEIPLGKKNGFAKTHLKKHSIIMG